MLRAILIFSVVVVCACTAKDLSGLQRAAERARADVIATPSIDGVVEAALKSEPSFDIQVINCARSSPLRVTGSRHAPFELTRDQFSPLLGDSEPTDRMTWELPNGGALAERLTAEATKGECAIVILAFRQSGAVFGFNARVGATGELTDIESVARRF